MNMPLNSDTMVLYCASPTAYGIGLSAPHAGAQARKEAMSQQELLDPLEYDEWTVLRKAQAWGAPLFETTHPEYHQTMCRLQELESKVRAALL